jgi:four helix bundle protein
MLGWQNLEVRKEAHRLVLEVYRVTGRFPDEERFRLRDQICRCASSVAANIVEGHARHGNREYIQFLYVARGSAEEIRYHLLLAGDSGYLQDGKYIEMDEAYTRVSKMLNALITSLRRKDARP